MKENINNLEGGDLLKFARTFSQSIQSLIVDYDDMTSRLAQAELRIKELEQENARLLGEQEKNGSWASRVTYENVVELIASYEDASQRDEARKLIEPLLKKEQVRQLRRDIRLKAKELESTEGRPASVTLNNPTINGPLYGISGNETVNLGGRTNG